MGLGLWFLPLAAILLLALPWPRRVLHAINIAAAAGLTIFAVLATRAVILDGTLQYAQMGGLFYLDAVSIIMLDLVVLINLITSIYTPGYLEQEIRHGHLAGERVRLLYILMVAFILTMVVALTVKNMGIMWIAIEATTLASVFLVGLHGDKPALEAAWKYIIICSVGITLALMGIIFLNRAAVGPAGETGLLDWPDLFARARSLDGSLLRFAFLFILIGFGTKAGLAPMHTWLPDAHSQAPSPISALLSGVLLNSAMYAIIRMVAIVNRGLGDHLFTGRLLMAAGMLSIATAALFILTQQDYKRLLAYSSIEHMGVIALALGIFTPLSLFAAFFHMINHSLTKSMLFLASGSLLQKYGTRNIKQVSGLLKTLPVTGPVFLLGLLAIGGLPPFSVFASEFNVLAAFFQSGYSVWGAVTALLLALAFSGIIYALFQIFHTRQPDSQAGAAGLSSISVQAVAAGEENPAGTAAMILLLLLITVGGLYMPAAMKNLIDQARQIIIGG